MASPSRPTERRAEDRKSVIAEAFVHDGDGLTAPTPRAPSTAAEEAWAVIRRQ